jgi:hypothetical protein
MPQANAYSGGVADRKGGIHVRKCLVAMVFLAAVAAISRAGTPTEKLDDYLPLRAAPEHHRALLENEFVLVLDVSIPAGATVPAHLHPWPAVFITLEPAHLVFRSLAGAVVREIRPPIGVTGEPKVEWREPDTEAASVANIGGNELRALRVELKFLKP